MKEKFREREDIIRSLHDENKDLFMQLDIEKAKFNKVVQMYEEEELENIERQTEMEKLSKALSKEKSKQQYYKEILDDLKDIH